MPPAPTPPHQQGTAAPPAPASPGAAPPAGDRPTAHVTTWIFLALAAFHVTAVVAWLAPASYARDRIFERTRTYARFVKADQNWAMFAPDPLSIERRVIVQAKLQSGQVREVDLTTPINKIMRSLSLARVGKQLKAHDRLMSGAERQYEPGFALYACHRLAKEWGEPLASVTLIREYEYIQLDEATFASHLGPTQRATLSTYDCPTDE